MHVSKYSLLRTQSVNRGLEYGHITLLHAVSNMRLCVTCSAELVWILSSLLYAVVTLETQLSHY